MFLKLTIRSFFVLSFLSGCGHAAIEREIDQKVLQENEIKTRSDLYAEADLMIKNSSDLSAEQKPQLLALRDSTRKALEENWVTSLKLKSVLIKDLVVTDYNENEVELIKTKIRKLTQKRLSIIFQAADKTTEILGRQAQSHGQIMEDVIRVQHD